MLLQGRDCKVSLEQPMDEPNRPIDRHCQNSERGLRRGSSLKREGCVPLTYLYLDCRD